MFQDLQPMRGETMRRARSSHRADRRIDAAPAHHLGRASIEASLQRSRLKSGLLDQATARLLARLQPLGQYRAAVRSAAAISCCAVSIRRRIRGFPRNISLSLRTCALGAPHPRHAAWLGRSRSDRSRAESRCDDQVSIEGDISARAATFFHPSGTCRMGSDPTAVVDPRRRVKGIEGLRVADASIMLAALNACTHARTIMIGEKAATMIAEDV